MAQLRGIGTVLKDGQEFATVSYSLNRTVAHVTGLPDKLLAGQYSTEGGLRVLWGRIPADGGMMTLRLEGGNEVPFHLTTIENIGSPYAVYRISVNGDPEASKAGCSIELHSVSTLFPTAWGTGERRLERGQTGTY